MVISRPTTAVLSICAWSVHNIMAVPGVWYVVPSVSHSVNAFRAVERCGRSVPSDYTLRISKSFRSCQGDRWPWATSARG
ncbi:hypothetical protein BD413DRAFT_511716 [Trametes elegans]|nr:hypothetical protein BD413DRAFT_511716 [Trametes elegans]